MEVEKKDMSMREKVEKKRKKGEKVETKRKKVEKKGDVMRMRGKDGWIKTSGNRISAHIR